MEQTSGTFPLLPAYLYKEDTMKAHLANMPPKKWALIAIPAILASYPLGRMVVPAVVHALVPEVVRSLLHLI